MSKPIDLQALQTQLAGSDTAAARASLGAAHPFDIATALAALPAATAATALLSLPVERQAEGFGYLAPTQQVALARRMKRVELGLVLAQMHDDERVDLFKRLPEADRNAILPALAQAEREQIRRLADYPEDRVGAVMTAEYATIAPPMRASEALEHLRRQAPESETIYTAFVVDAERRLLGTASLRDLLLAPAGATVADIMESEPPSVRADAPRHEAVRLIAGYDLLALPATDAEGRIVGIVTQDDAMDVQEQETTDAFRRQASVGPISMQLLTEPLRALYRARVAWLVLLVFGNVFAGGVIASFEDMIAANVALVFFLPLLIGSGGNAGSQAGCLMVRAIALGDVRMADYVKLLGRELVVALMLGASMAAAVSIIGLVRAGPYITMVVAMSMMMIVTIGSVIGISLPLVLSRLGYDPATASTPLITTIIDAVGVILYLGIAFHLFGLGNG